MIKTITALAALLQLLAAPAFAAPSGPVPSVYYVAPTGSDNNPGTEARPFATLERARHAIREGKKAGALPRGGVTVWVRGGLYPLARTLQLTAEDSGTAEAPITYRAYGKEKPILVGGKQITGFTPYKGEILRADVGAQGFQGIAFRALLFGGKRQHLARYPNHDPQNPYGGGWAYVDGTPVPMYRELPDDSKRLLRYKAEDARDWARPGEAEVCIFPRYNWWNNLIRVAAMDREKRTLTLAANCSYAIRAGDRYYVRNLFEELDSPGEWYLDTRTWTLYFWPPAPIETGTVVAPTLESLVEIGPGTAHVTLQGFTMECCSGAAVVLRDATRCRIAGNTIRGVGAVWELEGAAVVVEGGTGNGVIGNDIYDVANQGIRIAGGDRKTLTPAGNYADNNYIHHVGVLCKRASGINLAGVGNRASHNLMHDIPRKGIQFQGNDLIIEYNHVRHVNLETEDTAGIATIGRDWISSRGCVVRYNYIHDVLGYGRHNGRWVSPHFAWGVYLDDNTAGVDVIGNIIARALRGGVHLHNARDIVVENNIIVDCGQQQLEMNGWSSTDRKLTGAALEPMVRNWEEFSKNPAWAKYRGMDSDPRTAIPMANNKILRNVFYHAGEGAALFKHRRLPYEQTVSDYNLIYHSGKPLLMSLPAVPPEEQWEAWRKLGLDRHSLVADPLFVNAKKGDYRLRKDSPALTLGFRPIPVEKIGPYQDELRASWPIVEAEGAREKPLVTDPPSNAAPPDPTQARSFAPFVARRAAKPVTADGILAPDEWPTERVVMKEAPRRTAISGAPCQAVVGYDAQNLYVAIQVPLSGPAAARLGDAWGVNDGAEVCLAAPGGPVLVLRGFASGKQESTTEAGATAAQAARVTATTRYGARVGDREWVAEWAMPWSALGIKPQQEQRFAFNLGVRRTETNEWIQWAGALGATWRVENAGLLVLE